jgi:hypothetical protein
MTRIRILRTDGCEETHDLPSDDDTMTRVATLIGAQVLDIVNLRDGRVMAVDDGGYEITVVDHGGGHFENKPVRALKPVNAIATTLYLATCRPGVTHQIVGDVAIMNDEDFAAG